MNTTKFYIILSVVVVVAVLALYFVKMEYDKNLAYSEIAGNPVEEEDLEKDDDENYDDVLNFTLAPVNEDVISQIGSATISEDDGKIVVNIQIEQGVSLDVSQPAHIHLGECPAVGAVLYPLNNVVEGVSTTLINISIRELKDKSPLAINIHKSEEEMDVYTSCGQIS